MGNKDNKLGILPHALQNLSATASPTKTCVLVLSLGAERPSRLTCMVHCRYRHETPLPALLAPQLQKHSIFACERERGRDQLQLNGTVGTHAEYAEYGTHVSDRDR